MPVTLRQLRYFAALAQTRNFGRAADLCHVSQPALSVQVRDLEAMLGTTLIERQPREAVLTPGRARGSGAGRARAGRSHRAGGGGAGRRADAAAASRPDPDGGALSPARDAGGAQVAGHYPGDPRARGADRATARRPRRRRSRRRGGRAAGGGVRRGSAVHRSLPLGRVVARLRRAGTARAEPAADRTRPRPVVAAGRGTLPRRSGARSLRSDPERPGPSRRVVAGDADRAWRRRASG